MAKKLQILRGTTAQNDAYTGSIGELTMDTEKVEVRIHDGTTQGGKKIGSGGGASLPILTNIWSDHLLNDISWLRADTFSWQSGDVYVAAYEHLAEDVEVVSYIVSLNSTYYRTPSDDVVINGTQYYAWTTEFGGVLLTTSATPQTSDSVYNRDGTVGVGGIQNFVTYIKGAQTETIGDITISYSLADDGHKICLPDQESNIVALYEATGVAWYYILDTANKQFKLPRTKWGFTGLRDSVGGYVEAGLPNITGSFAQRRDNNGNTVSVSGAFSYSHVGSSGDYFLGNNNTSNGQRISFNASDSNNIYGNSDTVQPPATQMYLYFYVGNFEQSAIEQTAGINAEMFNAKADNDLMNITDAAKELMAKSSMPSDTYINLTLGASGSTYTAPADGWVSLNKRTSATNQYALLNNKNSNICVRCAQSTSGVAMCVYIPVKAGDVFSAEYSAGGDTNWFCFIYAEGAKHLA